MWKNTPSASNHAMANPERLRRINDEFHRGFALLETIEKGITFFGSAQLKEGDAAYEAARALAGKVAAMGYTTVTGGGPGIMEAASRGATEAGGRSVGFNLILETEQRNEYMQESAAFYYLYVRKVMLASAGHAYIFFPGGFGTLDEFFEISTLVHTHKLHEVIPVICVGRAYWQPLFDYLAKVPVDGFHAFTPEAMRMWTLVDTADEAAAILEQHALSTSLACNPQVSVCPSSSSR